jgi:hypothetical protein
VEVIPHHHEILHLNTAKAFHPPHQLPKSLLLDIAEEQITPGNSRDRMVVTIAVLEDQAPPLPLSEMGRFQGNPTHHRPRQAIGFLEVAEFVFFLVLHGFGRTFIDFTKARQVWLPDNKCLPL